MDRATQKRFYNLCDPEEPLPPADPRNVDLDAREGAVRGSSFVEAIARRIELSDRPVCELVTGIPGAGLTTELLRLGARLRDRGYANLLPVHIAAEDVVDLWSPIDTADVLLAILQRAEEVVAAESGSPLPEPLRRLRTWLTRTDAALEGVWPAQGRFVEHLRMSPIVRGRFRARVEVEPSRFVSEVRDELILLNDGARRLGFAGIVVLFDGLERLSGMSTTVQEVLHSAERAFVADAPSRTLPVSVVYTLPPALLVRLDGPIRVLPMIALADRAGHRSEAGFAAARELLRRRVPEAIQDELFGASARAERVDRLIAASGGSPGEAVRLLQTFIAHPKPDERLFRRHLSAAGEAYTRTVPESAYAWLARVHAEKILRVESAAARATAAQMLSRSALLPYRDDATWFDLHPAVQRLPGLHAAVEQYRGGSVVA